MALILRVLLFVALICRAAPFLSLGGLSTRNDPFARRFVPLSGRLHRRRARPEGGQDFLGILGGASAMVAGGNDDRRGERRFLKLVRSKGTLEMQTAQLSMVGAARGDGGQDNLPTANESEMQIDILLTTHLADKEFYEDLSREVDQGCDRVLFEMVAPNGSCCIDPEGVRRLKEHPGPTLAQRGMASYYGLEHQLDHMNFSSDSRWLIADLDLETVNRLLRDSLEECEAEFASGLDTPFLADMARNTGKPAVQEWYSRGGHQASWEVELFPSRFAFDVAKVFSCLLPCPEMSWLLLDLAAENRGELHWQPTTAVFRRACNLDFTSARKIMYAQHLVAGQLQQPGGVYRVLIRERNDQAVSEIYRARQEGCNRVSLIYGVMHATDLARKFQGMGFSESIETKWRRAWKIDDDDGFVPNFVTMAALTLLVGSSSLHWWEMVYWLQQSNECLWYGGKEVVESMWPNTDVVVSVVQYLQCPGESFAAAECRATLGYFGLHLLMYKIIRSVLL